MRLCFSEKQKRVLRWWNRGSPDAGKDAILCDGAVRSGKTLCLGLSFVLWSMTRFQRQQFALCGKTTESVRRNLLSSVLPVLEGLGFTWEEKLSRNWMKIRCGGVENTYFLFGGKDEGSAALIQGVTLAGVLLDEVALMPRSFVEQACARCSVTGAKFWFSCNPAGPGHWFYREWICKAQARNLLHLRFFMEDNPTLSQETRQRYERTFQGAFYRRFVPGGGAAGRGGADAPLLCGAGLCPVLCDGGKILVLLQPGGAGALVLSGVDLQGPGAEPAPPAVLYGGQPHPVPGNPAAV